MSRAKGWVLCAVVSTTWVFGSGCVSRDEYLRVEFSRRKAVERIEELERDLADSRARGDACEAEREGLNRELLAKSALVAQLQAENDRLQGASKTIQSHLDDILSRGMPGVEVVEVTKLPPDLDEALRKFAEDYPDAVEYDKGRGAVRWKSDLTFDLGSDVVKPHASEALAAFANIVNSSAAAGFEVVVVGHTDDVPIRSTTAQRHPTNWHLSVHRSISVMEVLHNNNVAYARMGCMGYGEWRPRVENAGRGGNEMNRRVEIFLVASRDTGAAEMSSARELKAKTYAGETTETP